MAYAFLLIGDAMPSFINRQLAVNPHRKKGGKMYFAKVFITLRESILDPAGIAVENTLHKLGFSEANGSLTLVDTLYF